MYLLKEQSSHFVYRILSILYTNLQLKQGHPLPECFQKNLRKMARLSRNFILSEALGILGNICSFEQLFYDELLYFTHYRFFTFFIVWKRLWKFNTVMRQIFMYLWIVRYPPFELGWAVCSSFSEFQSWLKWKLLRQKFSSER